MKQIALLITVLLVGLVAVVAFAPSRKVHEAALAPISVTAEAALPEPALPEPPLPPEPPSAGTLAEAEAEPVPNVPPPAAPPAQDPAHAGRCEEELAGLGAKFEVLEPIVGEDGCGAERPLKVSSVGIDLKPAVTTRCEVAKALAIWTRDVMVPSAKLHLKATPNALLTGDSYQCRARRGDGEVKVSEHAHANAIDISSVAFSDREAVAIMDHEETAEDTVAFQAAIRGGACAYFTTVLGPGANAAHADHLHFDLLQRKNGYRVCE